MLVSLMLAIMNLEAMKLTSELMSTFLRCIGSMVVRVRWGLMGEGWRVVW